MSRRSLGSVLRRMVAGAMGPLLSSIALFALPLVGAAFLSTNQFAFWSLIATVSTVALSLDFGGVALLTARYYFTSRSRAIVQSCLLSILGSALAGGIAVAAWLPLSATSFNSVVSLQEGALAIAVMALSATLRSILLVLAQAALIEGWHGLRNFAMAGHATAAVIVTIAVLLVEPTFWALPMGWLASGLVMVPLSLWWLRVKGRRTPHVLRGTTSVRPLKYALLRTLNTLTASFLMQGDRWIIGAIGGPVWLAAYEIAWRFASLPRMLLPALSIQISADVAPLTRSQGNQMMSHVWRTTRILAAIGLVGMVMSGVAYMLFATVAGEQPELLLFALMVIAFTGIAITSPLSIAATTAGRPAVDLPYALVAVIGMVASAFVAHTVDEIWVFFVGYLASIMISIPIFYLYAPKAALVGLSRKIELSPEHDSVKEDT